MKVQALTTPQQTEAATLKTTATTARTAYIAAQQALTAYLKSCVTGIPTGQPAPHHVQLSDDGTTLVIS